MESRFEQFISAVEGLYKCVQKIKRQEMDEFGLRGTHVMCLYFLGKHREGMTSGQLAAACWEDKAAVSRSVSELERRGLVVLEPEVGKRRYRSPICLTETGNQVVRRMEEVIAEVVRRADQGFSEEERSAFYRGFEILSANLRGYLNEKGEAQG